MWGLSPKPQARRIIQSKVYLRVIRNGTIEPAYSPTYNINIHSDAKWRRAQRKTKRRHCLHAVYKWSWSSYNQIICGDSSDSVAILVRKASLASLCGQAAQHTGMTRARMPRYIKCHACMLFGPLYVRIEPSQGPV